MNMVIFSVKFLKFCVKISANFFKNFFKGFKMLGKEYLFAVFSYKDQMDMEIENAMPSCSK